MLIGLVGLIVVGWLALFLIEDRQEGRQDETICLHELTGNCHRIEA